MRFDIDSLRARDGKSFALCFLPYLETPDGQSVDLTIGYPNPNRGYGGHGSWNEFIDTLEQAKRRMDFLVSSRAVEWIELRQLSGSHCSKLIDAWSEKDLDETTANR